MKKNIIALFAGTVLLLSAKDALSQSITSYGSNGIYTFRSLDKFTKSNFLSSYHSQLGLGANDSLIEQDFEFDDSTGNFDCRYFQQHKGYKVEGTTFTLHGSEGVALSAGGNYIQGLDVDVSSTISESTALSVALSELGTHDYMWNDTLRERMLQEFAEDSTATYYPEGQLVITLPDNTEAEPANYRLFWKFGISYLDSPTRSVNVFVDAISGEVTKIYDREDHGYHSVGYVETTYNGWMPFRTYKPNFSNWILEGDGVKTQTWTSDITDDDNSWNQTDLRRVGGTAHWAVQKAREYYIARHKRLNANGKDGKVWVYTYCPPEQVKQSQIAASGWDDGGKKKYDYIKFPQPVGLYHTATLDIAGHEFTHRVIHHTSNLNPFKQNIEAAALNEGFCDIFGLEVENHMVGSAHGWKIGEEVTSPYPYTSVRRFDDPNLSTHTQAKVYGGTYWDATNVQKYDNAGVLTHWFYLLANGGSNNGHTVAGIGMKGASDLAYITMALRLWPTSTFADTRNESLRLAVEWWGECSYLYKQVYKAWLAVGIGSPRFCTTFQIYGSNVVSVKSVGGAYGVAKLGKGKFGITNTNNDASTPQSVTWVIPNTWDVEMDEDNLGFTINGVSNLDSKWITAYVTENSVVDTLKHFVHFTMCDSPYCDTTGIGNKFSSNVNSTSSVDKHAIVYPNPVSNGIISIELPIAKSGEHKIVISNLQGAVVKTYTLRGSFGVYDLKDLTTGLYIINIKGKDYSEIHKLHIKQ